MVQTNLKYQIKSNPSNNNNKSRINHLSFGIQKYFKKKWKKKPNNEKYLKMFFQNVKSLWEDIGMKFLFKWTHRCWSWWIICKSKQSKMTSIPDKGVWKGGVIHPLRNCVQIYADSSKLNGAAGSGIFSESFGIAKSIRLPDHCTVVVRVTAGLTNLLVETRLSNSLSRI